MGFNPSPPAAWEKKRTGSREVAEATPLSLSLAGEPRGNPDTSGGGVSGLLATLHLKGTLPATPKKPGLGIGGCWSPGACLCWALDPGLGLRCLGCGVGVGTGWAGVGGNSLQTKNGLNEIIIQGNKSLG